MTTYTVRRGDSLSKIALAHKVRSWKDIYFHPQNKQFRQRRRNPNLIHPGDSLFVPETGSVLSLFSDIVSAMESEWRKVPNVEFKQYEPLRRFWKAWLTVAAATTAHAHMFGKAHVNGQPKQGTDGHPVPIFANTRIKATDEACYVIFANGSTLIVNPGTTIIVYGPEATKTRIDLGEVRMETGALGSRLGELSGRDQPRAKSIIILGGDGFIEAPLR
jgi:LysM repeat protein